MTHAIGRALHVVRQAARGSRGLQGVARLGSRRIQTFASVALVLLGAGCVRRQQQPDDRMLRAVEQEASSGVVAIATTMADSPSHITLCSGALVAPNLVLTARHCVSRAVTATPSCDARGRSHNGDHLAEDVDPAAIAIYTGYARASRRRRAGRARRAHAPSRPARSSAMPTSRSSCSIVRSRTRPSSRCACTARSRPATSSCRSASAAAPQNVVGLKVARAKSTILATGPSANAATGAVLGPREFEVDRATCRGDSGGPAIDVMTGEIVGIVSRGGSCSATGNHVYTRVDAYSAPRGRGVRGRSARALENVAANTVARPAVHPTR